MHILIFFYNKSTIVFGISLTKLARQNTFFFFYTIAKSFLTFYFEKPDLKPEVQCLAKTLIVLDKINLDIWLPVGLLLTLSPCICVNLVGWMGRGGSGRQTCTAVQPKDGGRNMEAR